MISPSTACCRAAGRTIASSRRNFTVRRDGEVIGTMEPAKRTFLIAQYLDHRSRVDDARLQPALRLARRPRLRRLGRGAHLSQADGAADLARRGGDGDRRRTVALGSPPARRRARSRRGAQAPCSRRSRRPAVAVRDWQPSLVLLRRRLRRAVQPDEMLVDPQLEARARTLSRELRCMVCQNQSIDDSDAPLARDLRILVRERLSAGDSDPKVLDFLVARYGEFVLLRPRFEWQTALLWLDAARVLLIGGAIALVVALAGRRRGANESTAALRRRGSQACPIDLSRQITPVTRYRLANVFVISRLILIFPDYQSLIRPSGAGKAPPSIFHANLKPCACCTNRKFDGDLSMTDTPAPQPRDFVGAPHRLAGDHRCGPGCTRARRPAALDPADSLPACRHPRMRRRERRPPGRICRHRREGEAVGDLGARQGRSWPAAEQRQFSDAAGPPGSPFEFFFKRFGLPDGQGGMAAQASRAGTTSPSARARASSSRLTATR